MFFRIYFCLTDWVLHYFWHLYNNATQFTVCVCACFFLVWNEQWTCKIAVRLFEIYDVINLNDENKHAKHSNVVYFSFFFLIACRFSICFISNWKHSSILNLIICFSFTLFPRTIYCLIAVEKIVQIETDCSHVLLFGTTQFHSYFSNWLTVMLD